jgi:hypothetical protein
MDDLTVEKTVEDRIRTLVRHVDAGQLDRVQLVVGFFEKRVKKGGWFTSKAEEDICWEQWVITVTILWPKNDAQAKQTRLQTQQSLREALVLMMTQVDEQKDHIPRIQANEKSPFLYEVTLPAVEESWGTMFKRMLTDAPILG